MIIRKADIGDAALIARCVLDAVGVSDFASDMDRALLEAIRAECMRTDSLYSYLHSNVAEVDGSAIGCVVAYPGEIYPQARKSTWERINAAIGDQSSDSSDFETGAGEYYLDTLVVLPQYRGHDFGRQLVSSVFGQARDNGYDRITLIAESDHPHLIAYYESMGFKIESTLTFLGEQYCKMAAPISQ